ncbi:MAG: DUF5666 domain-containing protein [Chloroflexales bacterium]|nr:DUF5666 domain-containing protein [Chloroflexales bacterium]
MMDEKLADIFATCLQRLEAGTTLDDCLAAYPNERTELEGLLRVVTGMRALPRPAMLPAAARAALETRVLAQVADQRSVAKTLQPSPAVSSGHAMDPGSYLAGMVRALGYRGPLSLTWLRLGAAMAALLLALMLGTGVFAAARAIINTASTTQPKSAALTPATDFLLNGQIEQLGSQSLVMKGFTIAFDAQTVISGAPVAGATANVRGIIRDDGTLLAQDILIEGQTAQPTAPPVAANPVAPPTATPAPPTATPAPLPPTEPPTATPVPPPPPTATPAPPVVATEPFARLHQILKNGRAEGLAGNEGDELIKTFDKAAAAFADGNERKTTRYLRDLFQMLQSRARKGKIDSGFAQQAELAIVEIATYYQLPDLLDGGGGEEEEEEEEEDDDDDDDDD